MTMTKAPARLERSRAFQNSANRRRADAEFLADLPRGRSVCIHLRQARAIHNETRTALMRAARRARPTIEGRFDRALTQVSLPLCDCSFHTIAERYALCSRPPSQPGSYGRTQGAAAIRISRTFPDRASTLRGEPQWK